jgi:hypothetical protein
MWAPRLLDAAVLPGGMWMELPLNPKVTGASLKTG